MVKSLDGIRFTLFKKRLPSSLTAYITSADVKHSDFLGIVWPITNNLLVDYDHTGKLKVNIAWWNTKYYELEWPPIFQRFKPRVWIILFIMSVKSLLKSFLLGYLWIIRRYPQFWLWQLKLLIRTARMRDCSFVTKSGCLRFFNSEDFSFLLLSSKEFKTQIKTVLTEILKLVVTTSSSGECNHFNGSKYRPLWT